MTKHEKEMVNMGTHHSSNNGARISRREAMCRGLGGAASLLAANQLGWPALAAATRQEAPAEVKAKSVIQIFLWGGMSHNDTWDPKP